MVNIAAIKAAVEGAEKLTAAQLEFAKDRIIMGTERKTMFLSEDSKKVNTEFSLLYMLNKFLHMPKIKMLHHFICPPSLFGRGANEFIL